MEKEKNYKRLSISILSSIGLANVGEWIYFIALNLMILNSGGTAFAVGILYIIRPIADMLTNILLNAYVDKLAKKKWMVLLTVARALLVGSLVFNQNLLFIYTVVFLIQVSSSIYEPLSLGYISYSIPHTKLKRFNSWNSLVSSGGFLIGPAIAGLILSVANPLIAILVNTIALFLSAIILVSLDEIKQEHETGQKRSFIEDNKNALHYLKSYYNKNKGSVLFYLLVSSLFIFAAGLDSVEAAFSKGVLLMSDGEYGILVSISGAGYLIGSFLNSIIVEKFNIRQLIIFGGVTYVAGYLIFTSAFNYLIASIGFFLISFALAYINTGFKTYVQLAFPKDKIGQLTTAFNTINSLIEMSIVASVSGLSSMLPIRGVLIGTEIVMVAIVFMIVIISKKIRVNELEKKYKH
ncbi:conserved membrane hypothetical protein [Carnobacterium maltaromaticum]|uniref:MFS transporter n=1 Tax=Carnobacterium maltaromaticum TaxID=2751 RepID=UPI00191B9BD0|nr:MFS transporter [Carnobacterium maltaromaticum]CAD5901761.1 conserved membrane hypothetical protein [Carnobacterium maltaromaticum]